MKRLSNGIKHKLVTSFNEFDRLNNSYVLSHFDSYIDQIGKNHLVLDEKLSAFDPIKLVESWNIRLNDLDKHLNLVINNSFDRFSSKYHLLESKITPNLLLQNINRFEEKIDKLTQMVELLLTSDRDNIKAYIVEKHHYFCYNRKWIDDYSMDCIEKKYETYKKENGNSYVGDLMKELRALPKQPINKK
jgi:hypothetical protein